MSLCAADRQAQRPAVRPRRSERCCAPLHVTARVAAGLGAEDRHDAAPGVHVGLGRVVVVVLRRDRAREGIRDRERRRAEAGHVEVGAGRLRADVPGVHAVGIGLAERRSATPATYSAWFGVEDASRCPRVDDQLQVYASSANDRVRGVAARVRRADCRGDRGAARIRRCTCRPCRRCPRRD